MLSLTLPYLHAPLANAAGAAWCTSSCRKGARHAVDPRLVNVSSTFCPASTSHGLYALHADLVADPRLAAGMDLTVRGKAHDVCHALTPPLPRTFVCVHPPQSDSILSKGIVWRGHWTSDCNEEYRLRTLCAIVHAVRRSGVPQHRAWVLDIGANIGTFTLPLAAAGINVVAFEADPDNVALLNGSLAALRHMDAADIDAAPPARAAAKLQAGAGRFTPTDVLGWRKRPPLGTVKLVSGALSASSGGQICMERETGRNAGSVHAVATSSAAPCKRLVRTTSLDDALALETGLRLGGADGAVLIAVKMDVQGAEAHVFAGATNLLRAAPPRKLYIETNNRTLLERLSRHHGYTQKGAFKDGCDYNVRLEHHSGTAGAAGASEVAHDSTSVEDLVSPPPPSPRPPSPPPPPALSINVTDRVYSAACLRSAPPAGSVREAVLPLNSVEGLSVDSAAEVDDEAHDAMLVPRRVHQTWKSCTMPERQLGWFARCVRLGPRWSFHLWTDTANREFVASRFPEYLEMYDGYNVNIKRVDAIRYFLLYIFGGVYMDLDFACVRSLDEIPLRTTPGQATLILQRKSAADHEAVSNAFMATPPRHPFFRYVIKSLKGSSHRSHVLDATGPRFLTRVYNAWASEQRKASRSRGNYTVSMQFEPWALLHRVHSCRPEGKPGPPCTGPWNFAPCKKGSEAELDKCARTMPNVSVTTFWTASWVKDGHPKSKPHANATGTEAMVVAESGR